MPETLVDNLPKAGSTLSKQTPQRSQLSGEDVSYTAVSEPESYLDVDFDQLLETRSNLRQQINPSFTTDFVAENLDEGQLTASYSPILDRIYTETNLFQDYKDTGVLAYVIAGVIPPLVKGKKITWETQTKGGGRGEIDKKNIRFTEKAPTKKDVLVALASSGQLPWGFEAFHHELVHSLQYPESATMSFVYDMYWGKNHSGELSEAHAYREAEKISGRKTSEEVFDHIWGGNSPTGVTDVYQKVYPGFNAHKLFYAIGAVDKLNALGLSPQEIGHLIMWRGKWDKKQHAYPKIEKLIARKRELLGLNEGDLDNLVLANKLEQQIDSLRAQVITQEELSKVGVGGTIRE